MQTETQEELNTEIGTEEFQPLQPAKVTIQKVEVKTIEVSGKICQKVYCHCQHPDQEQPIEISSAKYIKQNKVEESGLWYNTDTQGLIRKGSCLANFMIFFHAKILKNLEGKEVDTMLDKRGYLCFKTY